MADGTHIEWSDATWNVITGCSVVSPGCTNCYAMRLAGTRLQHHPSRVGLTRHTKAGPVWTGEVRFNEQWLDQPLRWTRPRMIFVCAHGDLFAEGVKDEWLDKIFAVMALCPQHTFQVLTKRPERMREYLRMDGVADRIISTACRIDSYEGSCWAADVQIAGSRALPLFNVWLGISAEDQRRANERVPILLDTPAAIRWVSAEPLLGPINFRRIRVAPDHHTIIDALDGYAIADSIAGSGQERTMLDWIVAGGESGPNARPMHPDWVRRIRDDCAAAGVAFNFKQWGAWLPGDVYSTGNRGGFVYYQNGGEGSHGGLRDYWWSGDCWSGVISTLVGKKAAGRLIDGVEHNGFPEVRS